MPTNETPAQTECRAMHRAYCEGSGMPLPWNMQREYAWMQLHQAGYRADDVSDLLKHLLKGIARQERNRGALKFSNFTALDRFEEDLMLFRSRVKAPAPSRIPSMPSGPAVDYRKVGQKHEPVTAEEVRAAATLLKSRAAVMTEKGFED